MNRRKFIKQTGTFIAGAALAPTPSPKPKHSPVPQPPDALSSL